MWRLETLSPLLKKSPKNQKKPWNTLREEHASSSSSGRTGSSKGFDVVARERGGSARKFGWFEKREEGMVKKNCVYFVWAKNFLWKETEKDRSGVCKRKKIFSEWRIRQVRVPDPWWRATRACTPMDTLWRSSLCTRREPYVHHLTLAVFSFFLSLLSLSTMYVCMYVSSCVLKTHLDFLFQTRKKGSHFYFASILLKKILCNPVLSKELGGISFINVLDGFF